MRRAFSFIAGMTLLLSVSSRADELRLKDGTKIAGTIIGFEDNSFKVKTSYGFAVVQKDQIVSISMTDSAKKPEPAKQGDTKPSDAEKKPQNGSSTARDVKPDPSVIGGAPLVSSPIPSNNPPKTNVEEMANTTSAATAAAVPAPTPKSPAPEPIREQVAGNSYVNETYGFRMYKPPDWELIAGARTLLPGAITAMGTGDQTTYLLIGQDAAGKSLSSDMDATEAHLRDILDNFRPLGESRITILGAQAIERRFRGSVDGHDWSGTVVLVPHGAKTFTIFGMTYADTDLVQIQENVISRAIASLQFTNQ